MKFDVSSTALLSRLQSISKVIASKNSLPILDSFLFDLEGTKLTITASDAETRMVTSVDVINAEGVGKFAVTAKLLLEPLKDLPEQPLNFVINDNNLAIDVHFENGVYNFIGQPGDAYPQQKPLSDTFTSISIDAQILLSGIGRSLFATADDELRPVMNGVYFDIYPENLTFVASDGHKLVRLRNLSIQSPAKAAFILPKKPATLLRNILAKETEAVEIKFDDNNAYVVAPNFEMICRLIEGRYPNYNSVIPQENPYKVTIDRISLLNALRRVSNFSNAASSLIKLQVQENLMIVSAQDIDFSISAEEKIACQYDGAELKIGFKATFLIEILTNMASEEVILELADPSRAGVIVPTSNDEGEEVLMLLMPMMLND
ncbi:DNA polymerase-3 subunit beta [Parabacteroides sp. PF5-5]|uniref:DNA polymerase III subunit beta n=1 Tax=unclassified Parabacteroides TaxID=2649774 RepID=UPI0024771D95|nr:MULTISPECIES: DNA polymerase III subunit beta [unclassified Parabacteroides]MDH6303984.1 DNA polymerase-3 subunit beta [Parabacteroides sp. PH5-39]MDH6314600.1 DNA polymerase-3 subunit beta [Parabacteroides sp. PF5-13]MDH6318335.1 DNA polymerase-3 subunit beta [Parabacteroides sp. PH5-13]MDH6322373.1 DNA polymerase-3 subunit beta [Parabacteroides sp. PH5-8]MDH6325548.1 DNA polymerase-3 subunit beta [Parabacteroides sp. PH5-41]